MQLTIWLLILPIAAGRRGMREVATNIATVNNPIPSGQRPQRRSAVVPSSFLASRSHLFEPAPCAEVGILRTPWPTSRPWSLIQSVPVKQAKLGDVGLHAITTLWAQLSSRWRRSLARIWICDRDCKDTVHRCISKAVFLFLSLGFFFFPFRCFFRSEKNRTGEQREGGWRWYWEPPLGASSFCSRSPDQSAGKMTILWLVPFYQVRITFKISIVEDVTYIKIIEKERNRIIPIQDWPNFKR